VSEWRVTGEAPRIGASSLSYDHGICQIRIGASGYNPQLTLIQDTVCHLEITS
jgi:hypothetical protein